MESWREGCAVRQNEPNPHATGNNGGCGSQFYQCFSVVISGKPQFAACSSNLRNLRNLRIKRFRFWSPWCLCWSMGRFNKTDPIRAGHVQGVTGLLLEIG